MLGIVNGSRFKLTCSFFKHKAMLYNKFPNECWVSVMKFLDRDTLQSMQFVSRKLDLIVERYFGILPLRRVDRCKASTLRSGEMKILLICLESGRTIETDSDLHLWLRHCFVECIEFIEFKFTDELLRDLQGMQERTFRLNYCVFDYEKRASSEFVSQNQIDFLFSIRAFNRCHGAVFSFCRRCSFRPLISEMLKLTPKSMVIELEGYKATANDNQLISAWLNGPCDEQFNYTETKALFLKGFDYLEAFSNLIETLQNAFVKSTAKRSFILNIECDDDVEFERREQNWMTGEKFEVRTKAEGIVCVQRE